MGQLVVGLTGGIGSGKTTVANEFQRLGAGLVDADVIARQVVAKGAPALAQIGAHFGTQVIDAAGELDRAALRALVFDNEAERQWLNQLLHPIIRQQMIAESQNQQEPYTLLVVPLLVENRLQELCQRIVVVDVPVSTQVQRTVARDNVSDQSAQAIVNRQASRWQRLRAADHVISNNRPFELVAKDVLQLHRHFLEFATQSYSN
ncbi:dephospho-CoA kinase [Neiella marina]|uniref:Dephospho-CoA kinase n=1 Tax=Neiella marina TaxID=508461 RepID=A0A8J2U4L1_9GAMM|nr:dephospho-CoA kinase [Neiella marina]GGA74528.1 dephospho-CoA kinase [Neiella marina]